MFELSLENINLAREAGYPENLLPRLDEREEKCKIELKKLKSITKNVYNGLKPKLSYPPHEKVPFIANCLDLKFNVENDRHHIIASIDLKVGDVVAIESPYCAAISPRFRYMVCAHCFRENDLNLIPCPNCHSVMFCSPECLAAANEGFHAIECPIMDVLVRSDELNYQAYIAFRLFVLAMKQFESVDELMKFVTDLENDERNVFNVNYEQTQNIDLLALALKLKTTTPRFGEKKVYVISNEVIAALTTDIILNQTDFKDSFISDEERDFLIGFMLRLMGIGYFNSITGSNIQKVVPEMKHVLNFGANRTCFGVFPFSSLMNDTSTENVIIFKHGTESVVVATKPIKSGEQLFAVYGSLPAYILDYPDPSGRKHSFIKANQHMKLCGEYKVDAIKKLIPKYCQLLNDKSEKLSDSYTKAANQVLWCLLHQAYIVEVPLVDKIQL